MQIPMDITSLLGSVSFSLDESWFLLSSSLKFFYFSSQARDCHMTFKSPKSIMNIQRIRKQVLPIKETVVKIFAGKGIGVADNHQNRYT